MIGCKAGSGSRVKAMVGGVVGVGEGRSDKGRLVGKKALVCVGSATEAMVGAGSEDEHADKDKKMEMSI